MKLTNIITPTAIAPAVPTVPIAVPVAFTPATASFNASNHPGRGKAPATFPSKSKLEIGLLLT